MSRLIESLENRMMMSVSVSAAELQADSQALISAAAAHTAAYTALQKSEIALIKTVGVTVKKDGTAADKAANAKLLAALNKESNSGYAQFKAADKALTSLAKSAGTSGASTGKALIAKPTNAALLAKVAKIITDLDTNIPAKSAALTALETTLGDSTSDTFSSLTANVPSLVTALQAATADVTAKAETFNSGPAVIVSDAATLAVDLGATPVSTGITLTGATLFRGDSTGNNLDTQGSAIAHGAWTTGLDVQNVPGNYGGEFFISKVANPTSADFLTPGQVAQDLALGANTFYFWANGDDTLGGNATFGLNLFLNGADPNSPTISGYTIPGTGQTLVADLAAVTAGTTFVVTPGAGTLIASGGGSELITLTSFQVLGVGGSGSAVDLVNSTNTAPFTPPPHADGVFDTYGTFTITVTA